MARSDTGELTLPGVGCGGGCEDEVGGDCDDGGGGGDGSGSSSSVGGNDGLGDSKDNIKMHSSRFLCLFTISSLHRIVFPTLPCHVTRRNCMLMAHQVVVTCNMLFDTSGGNHM